MTQNNWKKLTPWFSSHYYLLTTYCLMTSFVMLYFFLAKPSLHSINDLIIVKGNYLKHSFNYKSGRGGGYSYYLWLDNYSNSFKIKADFIDNRIKALFENTIIQGEELTIEILMNERSKLNSSDFIFIYSLYSNDIDYLNSEDTIKKHNSPFMMIMSFGFLVAGILYYIFRKRYLKMKNS